MNSAQVSLAETRFFLGALAGERMLHRPCKGRIQSRASDVDGSECRLPYNT